MSEQVTHAVTGAFGYSGRSIARRLLDNGIGVRTLTNTIPAVDPFEGRVPTFPLSFDRPESIVSALQGTSVLYNTYWVRFNYRSMLQTDAVRNTVTLFKCAKEAGVRRIVHVSITNPSEDSPLEYFRSKAVLERELRGLGVSYAILRPAVLFGGEDILINNIAWALRRLPVFGVFGDGRYRLQPIHVEDFAELAVREAQGDADTVVNGIGPETFTYRDLVRTIAGIIGKRRLIMPVPPGIGYLAASVIGTLVNDVFLTRAEIAGLMDDLLYVEAPPTGATKLTDWARAHAATLGIHYHSELARRRVRPRA
jgi:uncharacterized protein YbjT (DUF2867 family)